MLPAFFRTRNPCTRNVQPIHWPGRVEEQGERETKVESKGEREAKLSEPGIRRRGKEEEGRSRGGGSYVIHAREGTDPRLDLSRYPLSFCLRMILVVYRPPRRFSSSLLDVEQYGPN